MQVTVQEISPVEKKLDVEIPWEDVAKKLDLAYRELGKGVQLKGFRKGKVPRTVLEQMFGKQVRHEVAKELVQESILAAATEHKLDPVTEPVIEEAAIKAGEAFRYSARMEVRAPVELKEWEGLPASRRPVNVADKDVEHALEHKRAEHTEYRAIEGRTLTAHSDVIVVSLKGQVGELPVDKPGLTIDLGHTDHEPLPGISRALTGIPLDTQDRQIVLSMPEDAPQKELAGKEARLHVTIQEAREKIVPALDDEFAKDTGEAETLDELRAKTRQALEASDRARADRELREAILKELVARNPLPVAPALVERGMDSQAARARFSLAMMGIDVEQTGLDMGKMRETMRDAATTEVRGQLLLEALAERENLTVSDAEVDAKIGEMAAARDKPAAKLKAEMNRDGTLEALRHNLRQEKALDLVVSRATISDVQPESKPESKVDPRPEAKPDAQPEER